MAQAKIVIEASNRETRGKNEARRLRLTGKVPAVLYGGKGEALTLSVNAKQVGAILRSESGHNTLFQVDLGGKHEPAILKDWLVDREVEVECLPADIPSEFRADVSGLALNVALRAGDLQLDTEKIKLITDKDRVIAHVVTLKVEEEKPAEVAAAGATPAEPEVIKKGKKEEEGEEGTEPAKGGEKAADKGDKKK